MPALVAAARLFDLDRQRVGVDRAHRQRERLVGGAGRRTEDSAAECCPLVDFDRVDAEPRQRQVLDLRARPRPQAQPGDQPRSALDIVDSRRRVADAGGGVLDHVVRRHPEERLVGQAEAQRSGARQARGCVAARQRVEREVVAFEGRAAACHRFPQHRYRRRRVEVVEAFGRGDHRYQAERDERGRAAVAAAERERDLGIGRGLLVGACRGRREEREPERPVGARREDVDARCLGAVGSEKPLGVVRLGDAGDAVNPRKRRDDFADSRFLGAAQRALDVGLGRNRQHARLGERLERQRAGECRARTQRLHPPFGRLGVSELDDSARRPSALQLLAEQLQEDEPLALGDQVGTVEQRVAEPGEQLDQRAPRVAEARIRPLGRVRRNSRDQVFDQVVEATIVEAGRRDRHRGQLSRCIERARLAGAPVRTSR